MDAIPVPEAPPADHDLIAEIDRFASMLRGTATAVTESAALARIGALESLKATIASVQSTEAVAFEAARRRRDALNQVPDRDCGTHAAEEIALAKKVSPGTGRKFLSTSRAIVGELPNTFKALSSGDISEDKARIMVDETACLPSADRRKVDTRMKSSMGPSGLRSLRTEARALAEEMNDEAAAERVKKATANRRVTMTPLDDGVGRVSAILPIQQAVAVYEGLREAADSVLAAGTAKGRRHSQLMADTLVERLTGQADAEAVPTEVHLVIEAESLFSDGMVPAWLPGFGPLPAKTARSFIAANEAEIFIRRMFTQVTDGQLVGMESRSRTFTGLLRQMVVYRDDVCRTPWCDARIKHADHSEGYASGGATSWENGSGLCAACNYAKEHPGWTHEATAQGLKVTTPSGLDYETATPPFVRRMKYPRPGTAPPDANAADDWRLQLAGLLEPQRDPPEADSDSDSDSESGDVDGREIELPYLPISASEARKFVDAKPEEDPVAEPAAEPESAPAGESLECEIAEVVDPLLIPPTVGVRYRPRSRRPGRSLSSGRRRVPAASTGSAVEEGLREGMLDAG